MIIPMKVIVPIQFDTQVAEIQAAFSREYPFLKLEFFEPCHRSVPPKKRKIVSSDTIIGKIKGKEHVGNLEFLPTTTVAELEETLADMFGLSAQVYRRAGNIWIETNITDRWTLEHQNEQGRQLSVHPNGGLSEVMRQRSEEGPLNRDVAE
jgi:hypothetical protein